MALPGHRPMDKAFAMMEKLFDKTLNDKEFTLFVSHDVFIMYYIYAKTEYEYTDGVLLDFLDGMLLK
jgi:hypothetical protein